MTKDFDTSDVNGESIRHSRLPVQSGDNAIPPAVVRGRRSPIIPYDRGNML
jgi:hypothetical protein